MCRSLLLIIAFSVFCFGIVGCGNKRSAGKGSPPSVGVPEKPGKSDLAAKKSLKEPPAMILQNTGSDLGVEHEAARKRQLTITKDLEDASKMIKGSNLEGALRLIQRVQNDNQKDPNITMQTWYMQAMIFHRQKNPGKRKEAMGQMLQSMEALQKDPRFKEAYRDGMDSIELIKMTLDKEGNFYGNAKE